MHILEFTGACIIMKNSFGSRVYAVRYQHYLICRNVIELSARAVEFIFMLDESKFQDSEVCWA